MPRKGKEFELAYKWLYELDEKKYKITSPGSVFDKTENRAREVDVLIEYNDVNGNLRKIGVECRDKKNKENTMWIEQLKTKREDLELDFIIAITTNKFTKGAIKKARYHGIIIEEAEYFNKDKIKDLSEEFFVDLFFMRFEVTELKFLTDYKTMTLKEILDKTNLIKQIELMNFLNRDFYFSLDPNEIMYDKKFDINNFFKHTENSFIIQKLDIQFNEKSPQIIKEMNIRRMFMTVKMIPFKSSLPLNKSLSVFDVDPRKNKKFSAFFGTEEEYVKIGYLDNEKVFNQIKLKERKFYRHVGGQMKINTIFPNGVDNTEVNMDEFMKKGIGEFDFKKII